MQEPPYIKLFLARWLLSGLVGLPIADWWRLLKDNSFHVDPVYWPRGLLITFSSVITSILMKLEERLYGEQLKVVSVKPPIVIIGHWRSGTTHLHHLLLSHQDFFSPNFYQTMNPHIFLSCEKIMSPLWRRLLTRTRLIDQMPLELEYPQEEEFAMALLSLQSPYLSYCFPNSWARYDRYLTFESCSDEEVDKWLLSLDYFLKKLSLIHGKGWPLLKSPSSTGRLPLFRHLNGNVKFVHISRHPYSVFASTRHMLETSIPFMQLQRFDIRRLDDIIISRYKTMYNSYLRQRSGFSENKICEIRYEDLISSPIETVKKIFSNLDIPVYEDFEQKTLAYLRSIEGYRPQEHQPLSMLLKKKLRREWNQCFEAWDYDYLDCK